MSITIGFDVYGTLIDTHGVIVELEGMIGDDAPRFSQVWREKQLEYTFRRGLMKKYVDFGACTRQALDYTIDFLGHRITEDQKSVLISAYSTLPAFEDVTDGLEAFRKGGFSLYAFSNGQAEAVHTVISNAGFDVIGAISHGMKAAWIQRSSAVVFDHWEFTPTLVHDSLTGLATKIVEKC
jgi:2-haloacid dehalogenase